MEFIKAHDKAAILYDGREYSYSQLISCSKEYAQKLDIEKEGHVMIFMENRPELLFSFLSIWEKKGTAVCIDASSKMEDLKYYIEDATPKYIYASDSTISTVEEAKKLSGVNVQIYNVDQIKVSDEVIFAGSIYAPDNDAVALMLYTSGTTGNPKGVMLTFDNILVNMEGLDKFQMFLSTDRMLALLPMHHILPLLGSGVVPLSKGATIAFLSEMSSAAMIKALQDYKITIMVGVPRIWEMLHLKIREKIDSSKVITMLFKLCEKLQSKKLSKTIFKKIHKMFGGHIRFFVTGGSRLNPAVAKDFKTLGLDMCEGYGLTETAPMISFTPRGEVVAGSAGKILPGVEAKISENGEILARGRNVMKGYYNKPEETAAVIDEDGWFHTGDFGYMEKEYLFVTGRIKEMIVLSNGKNINPVEIEQTIMAKTTLAEEFAVIEYDGMLTAVVYPNFEQVQKAKVSNIAETLKMGVIDEYNQTAPNYKKILDIRVINQELPKTKMGKIRRFLVPDLLEGKIEDSNNEAQPDSEEYRIIADFLFSIKGKKVFPSAHIELDLGLDSLDLVEFTAFINSSFGIKLKEGFFAEYPTVGKIYEFLLENANDVSVKEIDWKQILNEDSKDGMPKSNFMGDLIRFFLWFPALLYFRVKNINKRKIKTEKPTIFIGNHASFLDGLVLEKCMPRKIMLNTCFLGKVAHFKSPLRKFVSRNANIILVDINKDLSDTLKCAATAIRMGKNIVIFPEGTRSRDGKLKTFKKFYAILAKELGADIIPFGIRGAYELFPAQSKFPKPGKIEFTFFDTMSPENMSIDEIVSANTKTISDWVYADK